LGCKTPPKRTRKGVFFGKNPAKYDLLRFSSCFGPKKKCVFWGGDTAFNAGSPIFYIWRSQILVPKQLEKCSRRGVKTRKHEKNVFFCVFRRVSGGPLRLHFSSCFGPQNRPKKSAQKKCKRKSKIVPKRSFPRLFRPFLGAFCRRLMIQTGRKNMSKNMVFLGKLLNFLRVCGARTLKKGYLRALNIYIREYIPF